MIPSLPPLATLPVTPGKLVVLALLAAFAVANTRQGRAWYHLPPWEHAFGLIGLGLVLDGQWMGLVDAPRERMMGEVGRVLYVHVPAAWATMVAFLFAFLFAFAFLMTGRRLLDHLVEATVEVGVVLNVLLLATGSIFARPTWGTWWTWDPRLTSSAVMLVAFVGVLLLRQAVADPDRRATWTSVATLLAAASMAVTYFSVQLWRSIHQMQSSPDTIDPAMVQILRLNAWAWLALTTWLVTRRYRLAVATAALDEAPPLPEVPA